MGEVATPKGLQLAKQRKDHETETLGVANGDRSHGSGRNDQSRAPDKEDAEQDRSRAGGLRKRIRDRTIDTCTHDRVPDELLVKAPNGDNRQEDQENGADDQADAEEGTCAAA